MDLVERRLSCKDCRKTTRFRLLDIHDSGKGSGALLCQPCIDKRVARVRAGLDLGGEKRRYRTKPRTHCPNGHDLTVPGALYEGKCRTCRGDAVMRFRERRRQLAS